MHRKILSAQPYMDLNIQNSKKSKVIFIKVFCLKFFTILHRLNSSLRGPEIYNWDSFLSMCLQTRLKTCLQTRQPELIIVNLGWQVGARARLTESPSTQSCFVFVINASREWIPSKSISNLTFWSGPLNLDFECGTPSSACFKFFSLKYLFLMIFT